MITIGERRSRRYDVTSGGVEANDCVVEIVAAAAAAAEAQISRPFSRGGGQ